MKKIVGFDFDGVICDSTDECLITGYNAWTKCQNRLDFNIRMEDVPIQLAEYFRKWRGFVRTADQYFVIFDSYQQGNLIQDEIDFENRSQLNAPERSIFAAKFFLSRERLQEGNLEHWFALNRSYSDFLENFKKIIVDADVYIVSGGKDALSIKTFLAHSGIDFPEAKIYDKSAGADKLTVLKKIAELNREKLEDITFIDDNINHILNLKQGGVRTFMADWGYHTTAHIQKAIIEDIDILNLQNWYGHLQTIFNNNLNLKQFENLIEEQQAGEQDYCVNCGSREYQFITNKLRHNKIGSVIKCQQCGLVRLSGALNFEDAAPEFYKKQYADEYHQGVKEKLDSLFNSFLPVQAGRISRIKQYLKSSDNVLEIGSSTGYFLQAARQYVQGVYGIEYNIDEAEYATKIKGIKTSAKPLRESEFAQMKFDHICLFQLFEHIANPIQFLDELKNFLTPLGLIHIEIPNIKDPLVSLFDNAEFRDFFYQTPHLYYYDEATLAAVVLKAGFKVVSMEQFQQTSITNTLNWVYRKQPQPCRWDCIQAILPAGYLLSPKAMETKNKISRLIEKTNLEYKNILEEAGFTDNIFCILKK